MCLAEALLRIPDGETADRLIADKIPSGDWDEHLGDSESLLVNASTWGLMLTGRVVRARPQRRGRGAARGTRGWSAGSASRWSRAALKQAMRILGHQFVMGRDIEEALTRAAGKEERDYRYSFDMLGEAALTRADAERYRETYRAAIAAVGPRRRKHASPSRRGPASPSSSRRCIRATSSRRRARVLRELYPAGRAAGRRGARCRHRPHARCRGGGSARAVAVADRRAARQRHARAAGGLRARGAGLPEARAAAIDWLVAPAQATDRRIRCGWSRAPTGTARSSARRSAGSPATRCSRARRTPTSRISPARESARERRRAHLSAVRDAQRAHRRARRRVWRRRRPLRVPAPARHGRGAVRSVVRGPWGQLPVPRLCAGRRARGPAALPGAAAARERRQHLVRQPHRRRERCRSRRSSADPVADVDALRARGASAHPAARDLFGPSARNSAGHRTSPTASATSMRWLRDCERGSRRSPGSAAPVVGGQTRAGRRDAGARSGRSADA